MCLNGWNEVEEQMSLEGDEKKQEKHEMQIAEVEDIRETKGVTITSTENPYVVDVTESWPERGVSHRWSECQVVDRMETHRGTLMEMIFRPRYGRACYMNGEIQSCDFDEQLYHQTLVHPAMVHTPSPRRVMVIGGGEGATAREALKWPSVERVDMYEWDKDVVDYFKKDSDYQQSIEKKAWDDPRLVVHIADIFSVVQEGTYPPVPYDVIIVDLFEPEEDERSWMLFTRLASDWLSEYGSLVMYAGVRNPLHDIHPAERWLDPVRIQRYHENHLEMNHIMVHRDVYSYKVFIPSFHNEACFLMLTHGTNHPQWKSLIPYGIQSHLSPEIWTSYHTWNQYKDVLRFSY